MNQFVFNLCDYDCHSDKKSKFLSELNFYHLSNSKLALFNLYFKIMFID